MLERSPVSAGRRTLIFSLPADHHPASVVGTFNEWTPGVTLLRPAADGWISAVVEVDAATDQCFRYLGADGWWFDELDADLIDARGSHVLGVCEVIEAPVAATLAADSSTEADVDSDVTGATLETRDVVPDAVAAGDEGPADGADDAEAGVHRTVKPEPAPRRLLSPAAWAARKERRLRGKRVKRMRGDDATS